MKISLTFLFIISLNIHLFSQDKECGTVDTSGTYSAIYTEALKKIAEKYASESPTRLPLKAIPIKIYRFTKADGTANITLTQIRNEIDSVNSFYVNAGIRLVECLAPQTIAIDSLYNFVVTQESVLWNNFYTNNILNLYFPNTVNAGVSICGYSDMPPGKDYAIISAGCAKNGSTLAHELGHYFGLYHTHENVSGIPEFVNGTNCTVGGDKLCDTPADPNLNGNVGNYCWYIGTALDPNNTPYTPNTNLIMSYAPKACRNQFTQMQYNLMNQTMTSQRGNLKCPVPMNVEENNEEAISFFPNPVNNELRIISKENILNANILIYDIQGKILVDKKNVSINNPIDVSYLNNGYYFISIEINNQKIIKPLICIH